MHSCRATVFESHRCPTGAFDDSDSRCFRVTGVADAASGCVDRPTLVESVNAACDTSTRRWRCGPRPCLRAYGRRSRPGTRRSRDALAGESDLGAVLDGVVDCEQGRSHQGAREAKLGNKKAASTTRSRLVLDIDRPRDGAPRVARSRSRGSARSTAWSGPPAPGATRSTGGPRCKYPQVQGPRASGPVPPSSMSSTVPRSSRAPCRQGVARRRRDRRPP